MRLLTSQSFAISTQLTTQEVFDKLNAQVQAPKKSFRVETAPEKPYQGEISGSTFKISRTISYRNSYLPVVEGAVSRTANSTLVSVKMRPPKVLSAFYLGWAGFSVIWFLGIFYIAVEAFIAHGAVQSAGPSILVAAGVLSVASIIGVLPIAIMFFFNFLMNRLAFLPEALKARRFLEDLFTKSKV